MVQSVTKVCVEEEERLWHVHALWSAGQVFSIQARKWREPRINALQSSAPPTELSALLIVICKVEAVDLQLEIFTSYTHVFKLKFLFLIYDDNGL